MTIFKIYCLLKTKFKVRDLEKQTLDFKVFAFNELFSLFDKVFTTLFMDQVMKSYLLIGDTSITKWKAGWTLVGNFF